MPAADTAPVTGLLLAAGRGRRMGVPKALLETDGEPWVARGVRLLLEGGCDRVVVVTGAAQDEVVGRIPTDRRVTSVHAPRWEEGMGESLRAGLDTLVHDTEAGAEAQAALVSLVDLVDLDAAVVRRVLETWAAQPDPAAALLRATYDDRPGHPVLLGRAHWSPLLDVVRGDVGAQRYLDLEPEALSGPPRRLVEVDCSDLATGRDADRPEDRT